MIEIFTVRGIERHSSRHLGSSCRYTFYMFASAPGMLLLFLTFALMSVSVVSAAPVRPSLSITEPTSFSSLPYLMGGFSHRVSRVCCGSRITEPTKVTVMAASIFTGTASASNNDKDLQARQWEWTPSAPAWTEPAWTEPAWTQPAWSDPAIAPVPTVPTWTPSPSYPYVEATVPASTPTYSYDETHRPDPNDAKTNGIIAGCVIGALIGIPILIWVVTTVRQYFHRRGLAASEKDGIDVETDVDFQRDSQALTPSTPRTAMNSDHAQSTDNFISTPTQGCDIVDAPRLAEPPGGSTYGPRRPSPVYHNNIPPQDTHWPVGEMEQDVTSTRRVWYREV